MRLRIFCVAVTALLGFGDPAVACACASLVQTPTSPVQTVADTIVVEQSQVALKVAGITCASCPQIVHQALSSVAGVQTVELRATDDEATVIAIVSCDSNVRAESLVAATNDLGYPTTIVGGPS